MAHVGMFPNFQRGKQPEKTLAILEGKNIYVTTTGEVIACDSIEDLLSGLWDQNLMGFVSSFTDKDVFPWLVDFVYRTDSKVLCTREGTATGVRISRGRESRWIVCSRSWGYGDCDSEFIKYMGELYGFIGVGVYPTPSSLGLAWMKESWREYHLSRHTTPSGFADEFIYKNCIGGRIQTLHVGETFDEADYYDATSAHVAKWGHGKPDGTSQMFWGGNVRPYKEWFARVAVRINRDMPLGVFPIRVLDRFAVPRVAYPTIKGVYYTALWRGQVDDAIDEGCDVRVIQGVGWKQLTDYPQYWAEDAYRFRLLAEGLGRSDLAQGVKKTANSGIGRHSGSGRFYYLVPERLAKRGETVLTGVKCALPFFVREETDKSGNLCVHWHSHTLAECQRMVTQYANPFAKADRLIAIRTDGVIVLGGDTSRTYAEKHSIEHIMSRPGTWIHELLTNLEVKANGCFKCDQFEVAPGKKR